MLDRFCIDESDHARDGLVVMAFDREVPVDAFISRRVMDEWVEPVSLHRRSRSLFRRQYNDLGRRNLSAIARIVIAKYERGAAFNRQHPYIEVLTADIIASGEAIDQSALVRDPLPPEFHAVPRRSGS